MSEEQASEHEQEKVAWLVPTLPSPRHPACSAAMYVSLWPVDLSNGNFTN